MVRWVQRDSRRFNPARWAVMMDRRTSERRLGG